MGLAFLACAGAPTAAAEIPDPLGDGTTTSTEDDIAKAEQQIENLEEKVAVRFFATIGMGYFSNGKQKFEIVGKVIES